MRPSNHHVESLTTKGKALLRSLFGRRRPVPASKRPWPPGTDGRDVRYRGSTWFQLRPGATMPPVQAAIFTTGISAGYPTYQASLNRHGHLENKTRKLHRQAA